LVEIKSALAIANTPPLDSDIATVHLNNRFAETSPAALPSRTTLLAACIALSIFGGVAVSHFKQK
jgi:hypothetical protein